MQAVNLYDSSEFEREIPHAYFSWLREHEPVHWQPPGRIEANVADVMRTGQRGYWALRHGFCARRGRVDGQGRLSMS